MHCQQLRLVELKDQVLAQKAKMTEQKSKMQSQTSSPSGASEGDIEIEDFKSYTQNF